MGIIATTFTKGYKPAVFKNQTVHQFYGNLQAVLREIDPSGKIQTLFAKPFFDGANIAGAGEVKWVTDLDGEPIKFVKLPPDKQKEIAERLAQYMNRLMEYSESRKSKTGIEKEYADYLRSMAVQPDLEMIFVVEDSPVIIHWGFIKEGKVDPSKAVFAGWEDFLTEIRLNKPAPQQPAAPPKKEEVIPPPPPPSPTSPAPVHQAQAQPQTQAQSQPRPQSPTQVKETKSPAPTTVNKPPSENKYAWVKWLAVILGILILLLLLFRYLFASPNSPFSPFMSGFPMSSFGGGGSGGGSGGGGKGGGGGGGEGNLLNGLNSLLGGGNGGKGWPGGGSKGGGGNFPGGGGQGQPGEKIPDEKGSLPGDKPSGDTDGKFSISVQVDGNKDQALVSKPLDPNTSWKLYDSDGKPLDSPNAFFLNQQQKNSAVGDRIVLRLNQNSAKPYEVQVVAENSQKEKIKYHFIVNGQ